MCWGSSPRAWRRRAAEGEPRRQSRAGKAHRPRALAPLRRLQRRHRVPTRVPNLGDSVPADVGCRRAKEIRLGAGFSALERIAVAPPWRSASHDDLAGPGHDRHLAQAVGRQGLRAMWTRHDLHRRVNDCKVPSARALSPCHRWSCEVPVAETSGSTEEQAARAATQPHALYSRAMGW